MIRRSRSYIAALALGTLALPLASHGQSFRVDSRIHTSSGSCASCDLSNKTMTRLNLKNADFSGSNFNRSNLSGGKFIESNLKDTHFRRAYLVRLQGERVDMSDANFEDATLTEAVLDDSVFARADMRRADMTRGSFARSDFTGADFRGVIAPGAHFKSSKFVGAKLDNINLENAVINGSNFTKAQFEGAVLIDATMAEANLSGADMRTAQGLTQAQLDTACGTPDTLLPLGLSIPYCDTVVMAEYSHDTSGHDSLSPRASQAALPLDKAISQLETLISKTPRENKAMRRELQTIHANLVSSRRNIEN